MAFWAEIPLNDSETLSTGRRTQIARPAPLDGGGQDEEKHLETGRNRLEKALELHGTCSPSCVLTVQK